MIKWILKLMSYGILVLLTLILAFFSYVYWPRGSSPSPIVSFHYSSWVDDFVCSAENKKMITPVWHEELKIKKPYLEKAWQKDGSKLLRVTANMVGKPFPYDKLNIGIFLCPNLPGIGIPILVPVRMYLRSAVIDEPWKTSEFIDMVYHEILHIYIARALHWNYRTPLLKKYSAEDFNTKIHLHLFALQKAAYLQLGMIKEWKILVKKMKNLPPQYARALAIVSQEGFQPFVDELKK